MSACRGFWCTRFSDLRCTARAYYVAPIGGVDFNEKDPPTYIDFAYLALTIGMTFQASGLRISRRREFAGLRSCTHSTPYLFGAVIVGLVINIVAGLLH